MKVPELIMAPNWPDGRDLDDDLTEIASFRLFWPVPHLPDDMGWLPKAELVTEDPFRQYFLEVEATFYGDGVSLYGVVPDDNADYPHTFIAYEQLDYLIARADTAVRGHDDPPSRLTLYRAAHPSGKRYRAYLGLRDAPDVTYDPSSDDLPF